MKKPTRKWAEEVYKNQGNQEYTWSSVFKKISKYYHSDDKDTKIKNKLLSILNKHNKLTITDFNDIIDKLLKNNEEALITNTNKTNEHYREVRRLFNYAEDIAFNCFGFVILDIDKPIQFKTLLNNISNKCYNTLVELLGNKCKESTQIAFLSVMLQQTYELAHDLYYYDKFVVYKKQIDTITIDLIYYSEIADYYHFQGMPQKEEEARNKYYECISKSAKLEGKTNLSDALNYAKNYIDFVFNVNPKEIEGYINCYNNKTTNEINNKIIIASKNTSSDLRGLRHTYNYCVVKGEKKENKSILFDFTDQSKLVTYNKTEPPKITDSHKKIMAYFLHLVNNSSGNEGVRFEYNKYLSMVYEGFENMAKETKKEKRRKLKEQIYELSTIYYKINGENIPFFMIASYNNKGVELIHGKWIEYDKNGNRKGGYIPIKEEEFRYTVPRAQIGGSFSLSEIFKSTIIQNINNSKRNKDGWFSLKVENILTKLGYSKETMLRRGYTYLKDSLERMFWELEEKGDYKIKARILDHTSTKELLEDYIEFRNDDIINNFKMVEIK